MTQPQRDVLLLAFSDFLLDARDAGVAARVFKAHLSHAPGVAWSNPDQATATSAMGVRLRHVRALPVAHAYAGRWGAWVIAKTNLPQLLERELAVLAHSGRLANATIFMSSATDPA